MRVLLLSLWYYPEPVAKPHDLASELVRRGHDVTVITSFPNYPAGQIYPGYRTRFRQRETIDGVCVVRVPAFIDRSRSGLRRVLSLMSFTASVATVGLASVRRPQLIWTYQVGLPGVLLSKLLRAPLVHDVQDLWPEWGRSGGLGINGPFYRLLDGQERLIYRSARAITTISNGFKRALMDKGVASDKITVLPNWSSAPGSEVVAHADTLVAPEFLAGRFNVIYGGNVGTAQALDVVLDVAQLIRDLRDVQLVLIGDGVERARLEQAARALHLTNVRFLGSRPPEQMPGYLACADALLLHLKNEPAYAITIPSKTYSYLAAGRPILAAASGDVADLVQQFEAGLVCAPENAPALANAIRQLRALSPVERQAMGERGRQAFLSYFTRPVLVQKYERLFGQVLEQAQSISR
jgi:colanic acid biosynthesis glycosyl transferase WcaI